MREHPVGVSHDKARVVAKHDRKVPQLHPAFRLPSQEFDLAGRQMRGARHGGRPVVLLDAEIDDQVPLDEIACHRRAGIRGRVLNVGPVHVLSREREVRRDCVRGVVRIADNQTANHEHAVPMEEIDCDL